MPRLPRLILALLAAGVALAQSPAATPPPKTAVPPAKTTTVKTAAAPSKTAKQTKAAKPATKPGTKSATAKKSKRGKQAVQQVQLPPPTPEQLPPTRPTVSYRNGQLSILANNSTMSDVLNAVRQQTGAAIDTTGVSPNDRVYVKLGPGAPKDILAALLDGSRFNFAILGSDKDPNAVAHVVLMPRSGGEAPAASIAVNPNPMQPGMRGPQQVQADEQTEDEMVPSEDEQPQPVEEQPQPEVQQAQPEGQQPQPDVQPQGQPGQVKTPEQLLQELQQMQRQQQQQNQQNPQPQQQPPDQEEQPPQ